VLCIGFYSPRFPVRAGTVWCRAPHQRYAPPIKAGCLPLPSPNPYKSAADRDWGKPLLTREKPGYRVIADLISATTTTTALTVHCELDQSHYPKGIAVLTNRWPPSTSPATTSMANGTTPSTRATNQIKRLSLGKP
jgi:hypothetical protein